MIMQEYLAHTAAEDNNYEYVENQQQAQEPVRSQEEVASPANIIQDGINDVNTNFRVSNIKELSLDRKRRDLQQDRQCEKDYPRRTQCRKEPQNYRRRV